MKQEINMEREDCSEQERIEIELLLEGIYRYYGYDFREYVFPSIRRRIWHRIRAENLSSVSGLLGKVLYDKNYMERLFRDFSINVTEMFRDPKFFLAFREKVVPFLKELPSIRIWHAGCSSGEEVYSMAILLMEEGIYHKATIYATDMNEAMLNKAKQGKFPLERMQAYTKNYLNAGGKNAFSEYYNVKGDTVRFNIELAENVVFAQHNLVTDCSFNEFHVIICRNVLIYFKKGLQEHVHSLFYDSLCEEGFLGLGSKESIKFNRKVNCYKEIDNVNRIYQKLM